MVSGRFIRHVDVARPDMTQGTIALYIFIFIRMHGTRSLDDIGLAGWAELAGNKLITFLGHS